VGAGVTIIRGQLSGSFSRKKSVNGSFIRDLKRMITASIDPALPARLLPSRRRYHVSRTIQAADRLGLDL